MRLNWRTALLPWINCQLLSTAVTCHSLAQFQLSFCLLKPLPEDHAICRPNQGIREIHPGLGQQAGASAKADMEHVAAAFLLGRKRLTGEYSQGHLPVKS